MRGLSGDTGDAALVATGSASFASQKSNTLTMPSSRILIRGLQVTVHDPLFMRRFQCFSELLCDRQRFVEGKRSSRDPIRECKPLHQLKHECSDAVGFFDAVNLRDVGMVQRCQHFGFALETCNAFGSVVNADGTALSATCRFKPCPSRARPRPSRPVQ